MRFNALERDGGLQQVRALFTSRYGAVEIDGVESSTDRHTETPATSSGTGQVQLAWLAVTGSPLLYDVRSEYAVVIGAELHRTFGGSRDVDAMHPRIAREDRVGEVADRPVLVASANRLRNG